MGLNLYTKKEHILLRLNLKIEVKGISFNKYEFEGIYNCEIAKYHALRFFLRLNTGFSLAIDHALQFFLNLINDFFSSTNSILGERPYAESGRTGANNNSQ
jgi:hypothetical protein